MDGDDRVNERQYRNDSPPTAELGRALAAAAAADTSDSLPVVDLLTTLLVWNGEARDEDAVKAAAEYVWDISCAPAETARLQDLGVISIALKAASHCYGRDDRSRLAELCFGILANIACLPAGADELTEREDVRRIVALVLYANADPPVLLEVLRLLSAVCAHPGRSPVWLETLCSAVSDDGSDDDEPADGPPGVTSTTGGGDGGENNDEAGDDDPEGDGTVAEKVLVVVACAMDRTLLHHGLNFLSCVCWYGLDTSFGADVVCGGLFEVLASVAKAAAENEHGVNRAETLGLAVNVIRALERIDGDHAVLSAPMMGDACAALGAVIDGCAWLDPAGREVLCEAWPSLAWFQQAGADLPPSVLSSGLATFANFARDVCDDDDSDSGYGSQGLPTSEAFDAAGLIAAIWRVVGAAAATAPDLLEGAWDGNSVRPGLTAGLVAVTYLQECGDARAKAVLDEAHATAVALLE